jgi:ribosome-binding protein aMBF1 (putative translation factor)
VIYTERQASASRATLAELLCAAEAESSGGAAAQYLELARQIRRELAEYDAIRSGDTCEFAVAEVDDLGGALVKARLARGWTQRQLAEKLGTSEQMVQKDESRAYENAGLARVAEVADVLGYSLRGSFQPAACEIT